MGSDDYSQLRTSLAIYHLISMRARGIIVNYYNNNNNSRKLLFFLQPTFLGGSSPTSRNPKSEYSLCLNKAAAHMHWKFCKEFGIEMKERWYEHEPKAVTEKDSVTTLWDMPIYTDRTISANKPDIVLKNKRTKPCLLIDMTTPLDSNTSVKTKGKLKKYKDSEIEVERMWGLKTTTVPVVLGARGTIKKDRENYTN